MAMKVNSSSLDLNINLPNLVKIEKMLNDQSYSDLIEFSANFNTRLCVERKLRMPFLDPQTGVAQNHSNLFMKKTQRIPGLRDGQIYTYPSSKWRTTRKRQYLTNANSYPFNYHTRPFGRFRDSEFDHPPPVGEHFVPSEEPTFRPAIVEDSHSKDSHQESSKSWYYDEMDIHDMDNFDDEEDSDDDFMEPRGGRKKRSVGRTPGSAHRRSGKEREFDSRRGRTSGRGRGRKVNPPPSMVDNSSNSSDKFSEYSRRRALNPPQVTTTHNPNPMSFDEAIPEHKIPTTERGKTHFDDDRMTVMSTATTSSVVGLTAAIIGSPSKVSITERNEKPRANPSTYCDFCLGDARENKKTGVPEELVSCSDCGRSGHPTCLQFTENMIVSVKKYRWQCIECKCCSICGTSENDEKLLFCDSCDAGFHMYCLSPPLEVPPEGSWSCFSCIETFYTKK